VLEFGRARFETRMFAAPLLDQPQTVGLDPVRPARQRMHNVGELRDLPLLVERVAMSRESGDPLRVCARGQLALGIDDGVELHGHA